MSSPESTKIKDTATSSRSGNERKPARYLPPTAEVLGSVSVWNGLQFFAYNFITRHQAIRMPPALQAGVTDHVWSHEELVGLIDRHEIERRNDP